MTRKRNHVLMSLSAALAGLAFACAPAHAGTYTVTGTCGLWNPFNTTPSRVAAYPACPDLFARNVGGPFATSNGASAGWEFNAPAGTSVDSFFLESFFHAADGWTAGGFLGGGSRSGYVFAACPGSNCPSGSQSLLQTVPGFGATSIVLAVHCGAARGCTNRVNWDVFANTQEASLTLNDFTLPAVSLRGGSAISAGWRRGTQTLVIGALDNSGIHEVRGLLDGSHVASATLACSYARLVPCPNGVFGLTLPTAGLADGIHQVSAQAVDASGNVGGSSPAAIRVDNTPPTQPLDVGLDGGPGWRSSNAFTIRWENPAQRFSPIAAARYELCPDAAPSSPLPGACTSATVAGATLSRASVRVPAAGRWHLLLWLVDGAGNEQPASAVEVDGLDFDDTPPTGLAFEPTSPSDPAHIHVAASDSTSGLARGSIEVQQFGQRVWRPLPTQVTSQGLTAFMNDEQLPRGPYLLRATAVNGAGLEASTDRTVTGQAEVIRLPLRAGSSLSAGQQVRVRCRRRGHRLRCAHRLLHQPSVGLGTSPLLRGRLTIDGTAVAGVALEVWRRLDLPSARWTRIGTVTTSRGGRFKYRVARGPAETVRFRYPGSNAVRGFDSDVAVRVRAESTLRPSRRLAINGEYVTFRGRLKGGWIPSGGVLVELQVYARGQWRTFAEPRAARNGRWSYQYRFETIRGRVQFPFRVRIPRQFGYPFAPGGSRIVRVEVRGL